MLKFLSLVERASCRPQKNLVICKRKDRRQFCSRASLDHDGFELDRGTIADSHFKRRGQLEKDLRVPNLCLKLGLHVSEQALTTVQGPVQRDGCCLGRQRNTESAQAKSDSHCAAWLPYT